MAILSVGLVTTLTALVSLLLTPFDFRAASRLGAVDVPKDARRMHKRPIPRLGGVSIFFASLLFTLIFCFDISYFLFFGWAGAILIVCVGVLDDTWSLPPWIKLGAQIGAAYVSTLGGNLLSRFGSLSLPLTLLWIVTLINAHNFIDGLDGLCGGVAAIEGAALGFMALKMGQPSLAAASFTLCGACIGFLPYNLNGARIFMGDCGSTFLGFALAWISVSLMTSSAPLLVPFLIFAVPLADITIAVLRRLAKGKSPFLPDRSHIHHMLADTSLGHFGASRLLRLAAALLAAVGYLLL